MSGPKWKLQVSSPPRRGCFCRLDSVFGADLVFPASAGVFPNDHQPASDAGCLPRLGGGVSATSFPSVSKSWSSPPRRGCFPCERHTTHLRRVFPASAGVFLTASGTEARSLRLPRLGGGVSCRFDPEALWTGLPRLGGGVSSFRLRAMLKDESSPPRRGCFLFGFLFRT